MSDLKIYENEGFENNPPDYVLNGLEFIGTCGACPEQYDVVLPKDGQRYQVGYIRLRGGRLSVECPDCGGMQVHVSIFDGRNCKGAFDNEEERLYCLNKASEGIQWWLWAREQLGVNHEY